MAYHKTLESLLSRHFPNGHPQEDKNFSEFLKSLSGYFNTFDRDKKISDHAFEVSEKEFQQINQSLMERNEITKNSILKLKDAIVHLAPEHKNSLEKDSDDIIYIINFLTEIIRRSKTLESELIKAKEDAEKAAHAKADFLSVMSHEIRTPLNAIIGTIALMNYHDDLDEAKKELLRVMEISSENLLSLINDVLDFNKLEEGKITFGERDFDLRSFLKNIKLANKLRAEEKNNLVVLNIAEDIPPMVKGDDLRLGQVMNNLMSNALKFTRNGTVTMTAKVLEHLPEHIKLYFEVADTGIGIPKDKLELIFERFTQANNNITREFGGSGLGLAIIKKLLQLQGSDILLKSELGKGSQFFFTLDLKPSTLAIHAEELHEQGEEDLDGLEVLLVEDVEFNVFVAELMLQNWNAKVSKAENGKVALEMVKAKQFGLILMDIQMPVMDGYTSCRLIREFDKKTPIIALTASLTIDIQEKAYLAGMNGFVTKPFNPTELYSIIRSKSQKAPIS